MSEPLPELGSERLWLRPFTLDDAEAFFELCRDPDIIRYVGNTPLRSLDEARAALRTAPLSDYQRYGYGRLACVWKASGAVIGFCGVKYLPELGENELGYRFLPAFWGQGLATEAGAAVIADARARLHLTRLIGLVHPSNTASMRVLDKLEFVREEELLHPQLGEPMIRFARTL